MSAPISALPCCPIVCRNALRGPKQVNSTMAAAHPQSSTSNSSSSERPEQLFRVHFEGGDASSQQNESPRSRWRRLGRLSLLRQGRDHKLAQAIRTVPVALSEPENSSSSTPEARLLEEAEMAASSARSQAGSSSSLPAVRGFLIFKDEKRAKKAGERGGSREGKFCLFGVIHVETGARLFLLFYVLLSACGVVFGSVAQMVWILVPLVICPLAAYSLSRHQSKYLYPLLVISVIHSLVALLMMLIVGCFSLLCFDKLKEHFAQSLSLAFSPDSIFSIGSFTVLCCALTMALNLGMALLFFWQSLVLFSCISHFDLLTQQRHQREQQAQQQQQQVAKESKVMSMVSAPLDHQRPPAIGPTTTMSRQLECSQCISEIRQLGQFGDERRKQPP